MLHPLSVPGEDLRVSGQLANSPVNLVKPLSRFLDGAFDPLSPADKTHEAPDVEPLRSFRLNERREHRVLAHRLFFSAEQPLVGDDLPDKVLFLQDHPGKHIHCVAVLCGIGRGLAGAGARAG
ncbi:MAG: hypothetical protein ABSC19_00940 [Syntrophorhabdales bacterium]